MCNKIKNLPKALTWKDICGGSIRRKASEDSFVCKMLQEALTCKYFYNSMLTGFLEYTSQKYGIISDTSPDSVIQNFCQAYKEIAKNQNV